MAELLFVIDTELELLKMRMQGLLPSLPIKSAKKFRWTGKATDLVELLYALDTCDCINDGEIGIEESKGRYSDSEYLPLSYSLISSSNFLAISSDAGSSSL